MVFPMHRVKLQLRETVSLHQKSKMTSKRRFQFNIGKWKHPKPWMFLFKTNNLGSKFIIKRKCCRLQLRSSVYIYLRVFILLSAYKTHLYFQRALPSSRGTQLFTELTNTAKLRWRFEFYFKFHWWFPF